MGTKSATLGSGGLDPSDQAKLDSITVANIPSSAEKAALVGTTGTPGIANQYVTTSDSRMNDSRDPTAHASDHISTGTDAIPIADPAGPSGLLSSAWAALLNFATSAATALTLVLRDAAGRFKAANPSASDDVDTMGARNTAISAAGFYDFGGFSSIGSATVQYMVCSGPNPNSGQTSPPRGYPVLDSINIERIAVAQNVGTGTAVHRFEIYTSVNGAAYAATGKVLDVAITAHYGQATLSPPLSLAAGDRIGLATWMVSGSQSSGATQVGARLTFKAS